MKELLEQRIPLSEISCIDPIFAEKITEAETFQQRILIFNQFIEKMQSEKDQSHMIVEYAIQKIYTTQGLLKIDSLSNYIGYTDRYIRKKFEEYVGFSPKQFCLIMRFQNAIDIILEHEYQNYDLLDRIIESGYHDQSHFIKSFKSFTNLTPKMFLKNFS